jgi:hypothetical protein
MQERQGGIAGRERVQPSVVQRTKKETVAPQADLLAKICTGKPDAVVHARALNRVTSGQPSRAVSSILRLQRSYGNRYVQRVLALARQGDGDAAVTPEIESAIERSRGGGQVLDAGIRRRMESAFGVDFSSVRIHTGAEAHSLNRSVSAVAFTTGQDIFFRDGAYCPESSSGRELLAHELTHVVQQVGTSAVQGKLMVGEPNGPYEKEADSIAKTVAGALEVPGIREGLTAVSPPLQRQCAGGEYDTSSGECGECRVKRDASLQRGENPPYSNEPHRMPSQLSSSHIQRRVVCPPGISGEDGTGCYEVSNDTPAGPGQTPAPAPADQTLADQTAEDSEHVSLPPITFEREPSYFSLEGGCDGLHLHGKADATFSSNGSVQNQVATAGKGCGCEKGVQCLHVTGTLVTNYSVSVTITMPPVPSGLTDCEQAHVRAFLQNVLRPHEEDHRARFMTYNGQTKNPVDVTGCGSDDIAQKVQAIGDAEDAARQSAANARSGAIDPFVRNIDCSDCEKGSAAPHAGQGTGPDAGASSGAKTPGAGG